MSTLGNVIASAVAPAGLQAQQAARTRDQQQAQASNGARRMQDLLELHLHALDDDQPQPGESPAQLHIDGELPQHQQQPQDSPQRQPKPPGADDTEGQTAAAENPPAAGSGDSGGADAALYRHVDIQA
jgi:hypothetical protein